MELVSGLYRFSANHDISMEAFGKRVDDLYRTFLDLEPEALRERLIDICLSLHEQMILYLIHISVPGAVNVTPLRL